MGGFGLRGIGCRDGFVQLISDRQLVERFSYQAARDISRVMAAHPVRDRPEAAVGPNDQRILIHLAAKPDMGSADAIKGQ